MIRFIEKQDKDAWYRLCTMLFIDSEYRGKGYGKRMMEHWEQDMQSIGYGMIMT